MASLSCCLKPCVLAPAQLWPLWSQLFGSSGEDSPPILFSWPVLAQDQLESVLEVLHRQTEQYRDQPQHLEKITCQQRLLQEDLVHIRAELCRESTVCGG